MIMRMVRVILGVYAGVAMMVSITQHDRLVSIQSPVAETTSRSHQHDSASAPAGAADKVCSPHSPSEMGKCLAELYADYTGPYGKHSITPAKMRPAATKRVAGVPAEVGAWQVLAARAPINVVHSILGPTGRVLLVAGSGNDGGSFRAGRFRSVVWNIATNTFTEVPTPIDLFCGGQTLLPDGNVLINGGTTSYPAPGESDPWGGDKRAFIFRWSTLSYVRIPDMIEGRWYPWVVTMANGRICTGSGMVGNGYMSSKNQCYNPTTNTWEQLPGPRWFPLYANMFMTARNQLFYTGVHTFGPIGTVPGLYDLATNSFRAVPGLPDLDCWDQGVSLPLYPVQSQKVFAFGGGCGTGTNARSAIVDLTLANPGYTPGPSLPTPAMHICGLLLPNGDVFKSGGGSGHNASPVLDALIYRPGTAAWTAVASPTVPRMYHSGCVLLPDGSVATLGSNQAPAFETRIEIYKPWYMFMPNRPVVTGGPPSLRLGQAGTFTYSSAYGVSSVRLLRPQLSVTHSTDSDQRMASVAWRVAATGQLSVTMPAFAATTPPGYYYLVVLDNRGVPAAARWLRITT